MDYSNITIGLENLTNKSIKELSTDMYNYKLLEVDSGEFLKLFFRDGIENSLFIRQIYMFSPKAVQDFQENIFLNIKEYFNSLIGIEGLNFNCDVSSFPLVIDVSKSEITLCKIDIFNKKVEVLEEYYFKDVREELSRLNKELELLLEEYARFDRYSVNSMEILKDNKELGMLQSIDIMVSSARKKKNKYKMDSLNQCAIIEQRVAEINLEIEDCLLIESTIKKNMLSISYYQNKIVDRLSRNLKYSVIKN